MKRTFAVLLAAVVVVAAFAGLVYGVLAVAFLAEPAATTVYGLTPRRLWATIVAVLGLLGVVIGGLVLARPVSRFGAGRARRGAILALAVGSVAALNGVLNLVVANGGPGTGNGVVGGAAAVVLGLVAVVTGWLALARSRRAVLELGRTT